MTSGGFVVGDENPAPHEVRLVMAFRAENVRVNGAPLSLPSTIA